MRKYFGLKRIILYILIINLFLGLALFGIPFVSRKANLSSPIGDTIQVVNALFTGPMDHVVYGYLPYWVLNDTKNLEYDKISDISYFSLSINSNGTIRRLNESGQVDPGYNNWKNSEQLNHIFKTAKIWKVRPSLTISLQKDEDIDEFLACRECWTIFLSELVIELDSKKIKDVSLDFEHMSETTPVIKQTYTEFVEFVNKSLDAEYGDSKLIVAAFADSFRKSRITDPIELSKVSDGIFIMAYDFHLPTSEITGPVAPLKNSIDPKDFDVRAAVSQYKENIAPSKLILGVPYYGANYLVKEAKLGSERLPGNDTIGFSVAQYFSMIKGNDAIPFENSKWDEVNNTPYILYKSKETGQDRLLYFENKESIKKKFQFAKEEKLGGVGMWALGYDGEYTDYWEAIKEEFK